MCGGFFWIVAEVVLDVKIADVSTGVYQAARVFVKGEGTVETERVEATLTVQEQ